ncbi:MAG TPA: hypothetical protein GXX40_08845 [Firmicutes bacterium]|nr:hypothetical protein [Bacillota bacterium]
MRKILSTGMITLFVAIVCLTGIGSAKAQTVGFSTSMNWYPSYPVYPWYRQSIAGKILCRLDYDWNIPGKLTLSVTNVSGKELNLHFPTSKTHDFVVYSGGVPIWRASDGKAYSQVAQDIKLAAGETRSFTTELPWLAPGMYWVEAYLAADGYNEWPVAQEYLDLGWLPYYYCVDPLQYSISFQYRSWPYGARRILLTVRNPLSYDVFFPQPHSYEVIFRAADGTVVRKSIMSMSQSYYYEKIGAGHTQYYFVDVPEIASSFYQVEVWLKVGNAYLRQLGTMWITP